MAITDIFPGPDSGMDHIWDLKLKLSCLHHLLTHAIPDFTDVLGIPRPIYLGVEQSLPPKPLSLLPELSLILETHCSSLFLDLIPFNRFLSLWSFRNRSLNICPFFFHKRFWNCKCFHPPLVLHIRKKLFHSSTKPKKTDTLPYSGSSFWHKLESHFSAPLWSGWDLKFGLANEVPLTSGMAA